MVFSDSTDKTGLVEDIDSLCGTNSSTYLIADKTRNINNHYRETVVLIWQVQDGWQWDDSSQTTLPVATKAIVSGQSDYDVPSTAFAVERVEVLDGAGNYIKLIPIDKSDVSQLSMTEFQGEGMPIYYDLVGKSVILYPTPITGSVTLASGIKIYVSRDIVPFDVADTTEEPGFDSPFHKILSYGAAIDFLGLDDNRRAIYMSEKQRLTEGLKNFYSKRNVERKVSINPADRKYWRQYK